MSAFLLALAAAANLNFSPSQISTAPNKAFTFNITVNTANTPVSGIGAKIFYDPKMLTILSLNKGQLFPDYATLNVSSESGKITVSGLSASKDQQFSGQGILATVTAKTLAPGQTTLKFDYTPGSTTDSNIAVAYPPWDILSSVNTLSINSVPSVPQSSSVLYIAAISVIVLGLFAIFWLKK